jgi:hypothetical protein
MVFFRAVFLFGFSAVSDAADMGPMTERDKEERSKKEAPRGGLVEGGGFPGAV